MTNRDRIILIKIIDEINVIEKLIEGYLIDEFISDEKTKRATAMTLINIGELVKSLTEEFRLETKSIPWRAIAGMRDITAHKYQSLNMGDVWVTVIDEIPKFKIDIADLLKN